MNSFRAKIIDTILGKLKGFAKSPLFYLGVALIAILVLCSYFSDSTQKNQAAEADKLSVNESQQSCFLDSNIKFKPESPDFILVQNSCLKAAPPPVMITPQVLGAILAGSEILDEQKKEIIEYTVEQGDTLSTLSEKFGISVATITGANSLTKSSALKAGQKLVILPVSGVVHHVKSGDTLGAIVEKYKGKTENIVAFNNLSSEEDIYVGDVLIIPGGVIPVLAPVYVEAPLTSSYFICPISSQFCRNKITQYLHWYNAIDFNGDCGDAIIASAAGTVLKVKLTESTSKWAYNGAGNHMTILHPNGVVTYYGHFSRSFVNPGDTVYQGQIIAIMGGQPGTAGAGSSTGCHLHFGVSGAKNPFNR